MRKYERIEQSLCDQINSGKISLGAKLPSENELCRQFNVSRNVVRQALKNLERRGLTESLKGVGTFCRRSTRAEGLSTTIGFIGFFSQSYIFPRIIEGIDSVLYQEGFHLLLGQSLYNLARERKLLEGYMQKEIDGIILEPVCDGNAEYSNKKTVQRAIEQGIPVVFIDNVIPGIETAMVKLNDYQTGRYAAEYLFQRGHRNIGLFYQEDYFTKLQRKAGAEAFIASREKEGMTCCEGAFRGQGESSNVSEQAMRFLTSAKDRITAVFCTSDEDALAVIETAESLGIAVPEDLSVIGFDNWNALLLEKIGLTTFEHPGSTMGGMIARSLVDAIYGRSQPKSTSIVLEPRLVERSSVRDLRKG